MTDELFKVTIAALCVAWLVVGGWLMGKTDGYDEGVNDGYRLGYLIGEFNALCAHTERDMDEDGDAE